RLADGLQDLHRLEDELVDRVRALRAADDEDAGAFTRGVGERVAHALAHGKADQPKLLLRERFLRALEGTEDQLDEAGQPLVRDAGNRVLLVDGGGPAAQRGGEHEWTRRVPADAHDDIGIVLLQKRARLPHRARGAHEPRRLARDALVLDADDV